MALDGYLSDVNNKRIYYFPIDDTFHTAIFQDHRYWNSYIQLRKLRGYYVTVKFNKKETEELANDFEQYLMHVNPNYHPKIKELISQLREDRIVKVAFHGD
ncbi:hypothetical protein [Paenibacillus sp.]|jgi:hypothetical protein|uniref:hypothetical protein n=1 Tax=Paenibacillus sp. TaxID=58172 RepID=UPI00282BDB95|nr:hypothetical protein [Paenibacillus sp.]MDR0271139.1 hypothetical protein [Paenibacillus sp.]